MATVPKMFPFMKGRVGNLVFKTRLGKQYICTVPDHYTTSYSEPAVKGRNNFAFFSRLSNVISHNHVLNTLWRDIRIPGLTTQNIIYKMLHKQVTGYDLSGIFLAPCDEPFNVSLKEVIWQGDTMNVSFQPLGKQHLQQLENPVICAQGFVYLYDPAKEKKDQFTFIPLNSNDQSISLTDELCFSFKFSKTQLSAINSAPEIKLVINLAIKDLAGKPVRCSNTICIELVKEILESEVLAVNESAGGEVKEVPAEIFISSTAVIENDDGNEEYNFCII